MSGGKMDKRIRMLWKQTSGTGQSSGKLISPTEYFNSISRNNQGETDKIIYLNKNMVGLLSGDNPIDFDEFDKTLERLENYWRKKNERIL